MRFFPLIFALISFAPVDAQKRVVGAIGFYNVENLFDTEDDPEINDAEYLPDGALLLAWKAEKPSQTLDK